LLSDVKIEVEVSNHLSKELQKYYTREGNRVVFYNSMTLNQLALEMWEKLGYKEIDASVISRVINGERLITGNQLEAFVKILKISSTESLRLREALIRDYSERIGFDENLLEGKNRVDFDSIDEIFSRLKEIKLRDVNFTDSWLNELMDRAQEMLLSTFDSRLRKRILKLEGEILVEQILCFSVMQTKKISSSRLITLASRLRATGRELKNKDFLGMGYYEEGNNNYVRRNYQRALKLLKMGVLTDFDSLDSGKTSALRASLLTEAYLKDEANFQSVKGLLVKRAPILHIDLQCAVFEAIARGEALLGHSSEAGKFLSKATKIQEFLKVSKSERADIRRVQIVLTEMESAKWIKGMFGRVYLEKIGKEGMEISKEHGFKRLEENAKDLLKDLRLLSQPDDFKHTPLAKGGW
jgi:hypothetical protein